MKKGFTLIELLAVIVILAIIVLIATPLLMGVIKNSKKEAFKSSSSMIVNGLDQKHIKDQISKGSGEVEIVFKNGEQISSQKIDMNGELPVEGYAFIDKSGKSVFIATDGTTVVEKTSTTEVSVVSETAEPFDLITRYNELKSELSYEFTCGKDLVDSRDGNLYRTSQIGNQCWFEDNLAYDCSNNPSYTNIGYGDEWVGEQNCATSLFDGREEYMYQWKALMNWDEVTPLTDLEGNRGVCPLGWHVPSHGEWTDLERTLCNELGNSDCDATFSRNSADDTTGFYGSNEGEFLRDSELWNMKYVGLRLVTGGLSNDFSRVGYSTSSGSIRGENSWVRYFYSFTPGINRFTNWIRHGFVARCIED